MSRLLPPNANTLEVAAETSINAAIESIPVPIRDLWNPERCPVELLPWLAWALSVDHWNPAWSERIQRSVIAQSIPVHRKKGTIGALRRALGALGHGVKVSEWYQYGGRPYRFRLNVELTERGLSATEQQEILLTAKQAKNARSWLEALIIHLTSRGDIRCAAAVHSGELCTIYPYAITTIELSFAPPVALGVYGVETTTVYPQ
ncbi:MAG: phage tail protein I [Candidatus Sedimenticola sp. 6PFRAG7]